MAALARARQNTTTNRRRSARQGSLPLVAPESCAPLARLNRRGLASRGDLAGRFALGQAASLANCRRGPR
jgi:hypothetical protein